MFTKYLSYVFARLTVYGGFMIIGIFFIQFYPIILDIVLPLDEPRPYKLLVTLEYFVSQDKYIYTSAARMRNHNIMWVNDISHDNAIVNIYISFFRDV